MNGMEENKDIDKYPFIKNVYYPGKLLHARDFTNEQEYVNRKLEFINRKFHGWGIIEGMEVRTEQDGSLYLSPGSAIDPCGRILVETEDREVQVHEIENLSKDVSHNFILGIRYKEQTAETEQSLLERDKPCRPAKIAETYSFGAFRQADFEKLKKEGNKQENILTEEKILYENETVRLMLRIPRVIPSDSIFRVRILVQTAKSNVRVGWRGMGKLQGAFFAKSGESFVHLEGKQTVCPGSLQWEWEICTEEKRKLPVMLEISHLEITMENHAPVEITPGQFFIRIAALYENTVREYLWRRESKEPEQDWIPLAYLRMEKSLNQEKCTFLLLRERNVRFMAFHPEEEEIIRRNAEENGIVDIRWRNVLKHIWHVPLPPKPLPPPPPSPGPMPWEDMITRKQAQELMEEDRKNRIHKGIAKIPVPKFYRRGQTLFSGEIFHGFPGEEVFLWCGRVSEPYKHELWERKEIRHKIICGDEELFEEIHGKEWRIKQQAVRQNVEAGTFQIALTLAGRCWQERGKEVVISWIAVKSI